MKHELYTRLDNGRLFNINPHLVSVYLSILFSQPYKLWVYLLDSIKNDPVPVQKSNTLSYGYIPNKYVISYTISLGVRTTPYDASLFSSHRLNSL